MPGPDDPSLAEAFAVYNAIHFAKECCFHEVQFESDNARVIASINSADSRPRNYVDTIIRGIRCNRDGFRRCSFRNINRSANQAAPQLASLTHEEPNRVWIEESPIQLISTLVRDLIH
jgi:ribonuclease HI